MPTSGKRLLAAFVAGMIAASLLVALPLYTIRERVLDLEEREDEAARAANRTAAEHLLEASAGVEAWVNGTSPNLVGASLHAAVAQEGTTRALAGDTAPLPDALERAQEALSTAERAAACGVLERRSPGGTALLHLGQALDRAGQRLSAGERVDVAVLDGTTEATTRTLEAHLSGLASLQDANVSVPSERVHVVAGGPLPEPTCRDALDVDVCLVGAKEQCTSTRTGTVPLDREGSRGLAVPVPGEVDAVERVQVNVETRVAGVSSTGEATVPLPSWPLELETLDQGSDSQINTSRATVVSTSSTWEELWTEHAGDAERPSVDFETQRVAAVFQGDREHACHGVSVDGVTLQANGSARVEARAIEVAGVGCPERTVAPYHLVAVPHMPGTTTIDVRDRILGSGAGSE